MDITFKIRQTFPFKRKFTEIQGYRFKKVKRLSSGSHLVCIDILSCLVVNCYVICIKIK